MGDYFVCDDECTMHTQQILIKKQFSNRNLIELIRFNKKKCTENGNDAEDDADLLCVRAFARCLWGKTWNSLASEMSIGHLRIWELPRVSFFPAFG